VLREMAESAAMPDWEQITAIPAPVAERAQVLVIQRTGRGMKAVEFAAAIAIGSVCTGLSLS